MTDPLELRPVGRVRSPLRSPAAAPKQGTEGGVEAWLDLDPELAPALDGVRPGQELLVLTWLHLADRGVLVVHPRDDPATPLRGVFATRSADRPNPLGLHRVTVLAADRTSLRVAPLEAVDGTPVVDLKPVLTGGDR